MNKLALYLIVVVIVLMAFLSGFSGYFLGGNKPSPNPENVSEILTFKEKGSEACYQDGKPVIRLFSTTWCPHCIWAKPAFDSVMKKYADAGKIIAYHWELDTGDNTLTSEVENKVPDSELAVYQEFNPGGSIPTFVFGCKYYRIGTGFERQNDLSSEEAEYRAVIEELLK